MHFRTGNAPELKVAVATRRTLARGWFALQWKLCFKPWFPPPAPVGTAGTDIFQLSPAWEMNIICNIFWPAGIAETHFPHLKYPGT
jgi:hypothetical protein